MTQILPNNFLVHRQIQLVTGLEHDREVLPSAGGDKLRSVHVILHAVEVLRAQFKIGQNRRMQPMCAGVFLPDGQIRLNVNAAHTIQRHEVKIPHALVVLRRVARCHNDPACRDGLIAEGFALKELQHGRSQRFGHTVDFVNEKNSVFHPGLLHLFIDACDDFTHRVLRHAAVLAVIAALTDKRKPHGALSCMVGDCVGHERDAAFLCNLLHNLGFANARRAHQQNGTLTDGRNQRFTGVVHRKIGFDGLLNLLFGSFDIHRKALPLITAPAAPPAQVRSSQQRAVRDQA